MAATLPETPPVTELADEEVRVGVLSSFAESIQELLRQLMYLVEQVVQEWVLEPLGVLDLMETMLFGLWGANHA